jgi:hypothetical protein
MLHCAESQQTAKLTPNPLLQQGEANELRHLLFYPQQHAEPTAKLICRGSPPASEPTFTTKFAVANFAVPSVSGWCAVSDPLTKSLDGTRGFL